MENKINVLHLSTYNEDCGIAKFQESIVDGLGNQRQVGNKFFPISPNKLKVMGSNEFDEALSQLKTMLGEFDILHIQHEYSFYGPGQLQKIVDAAKSANKKIIFTLHTPPHAHRQLLASFGIHHLVRPRTLLHVLRSKKAEDRFRADYITPLLGADVLVATSKESVISFGAYGVPASLIEVVHLPVPVVDATVQSSTIATYLQKQPGDIIISTAGFISETKGIIPAVKALKLLPEKYKLAIIGGSHPSGQNDAFYDHVCDVVLDLNLEKRVYITGYIESDSVRDSLLRETDICLYPYDHNYYDYVSSAALNNAVANGVPIVAYKTKTFMEASSTVPFITFTQSANYYELARSIQAVNLKESKDLVAEYAELFSIDNQSKKFAELYDKLVG